MVKWVGITEMAELFALYNLKEYTLTYADAFLFIGMGAYAITGYFVTYAISSGGVGVANGLWNAFSNLAGALIGLYTGESYNWIQILGLVLGGLSSILLSIK